MKLTELPEGTSRAAADLVDRVLDRMGPIGFALLLWTIVTALAVWRVTEPAIQTVWPGIWYVWVALAGLMALFSLVSLTFAALAQSQYDEDDETDSMEEEIGDQGYPSVTTRLSDERKSPPPSV